MNSDPSNTELPLDEQLVAYLDGELDAESGRRIEALLASDPDVRRRLQSLERTWDLLDELDAAPVGEPFTQTTLEMVAVAAHEDVERSRAEAPLRRRRWLWTIGGSLLAAVAVGFLAVAVLWPDPNRQLLQDLPVLENFDEYRQVESIEFLHELRKKGLFLPRDAGRPQGKAATVEDLQSRRQRVHGMDRSEKEQLLQIEERFTGLPREEQQRLRRLHEDLQNVPDAERLGLIMHNYCEWLKTLSSYTRAELAELKPAERADQVQKRLQDERRRAGGRRPGDKDMKAIWDWMGECATRLEPRILKTLPEARQRELEKRPELRRRVVLSELAKHWQEAGPGKLPPMMTDEDLKELRGKLSAETQDRLEKLPTPQQWLRVAVWMRQGRHPGPGRGMRGPLPKPDDERLANFFEKELTDEERDRLLGLPGEDMQQELMRLFVRRTRLPEGPRLRPEGPNVGPWPGERLPPREPPPKEPPQVPRPPQSR
jgi:hypothetical protein